MSGYEQRLAADKAEIRTRVVAVGAAVGRAVSAAVEGLQKRDRAACYRTVLGDLPINREIRAIDKLCHAFVARHLPSAGHLRFVSSVLQMNVALERIGDYAVTIAREAVQLKQLPPEPLTKDLQALATGSVEILRDALLAFSERDSELARKTRPRAKAVEKTYSQVYRDLTEEGRGLPLGDAFALLAVFHRLERVSDQAKNISEETLFELTGETKPATQYRVLFVDADGMVLAPLAAAWARKAFPESGHYTCAALRPAGSFSPGLHALADELGLDLSAIVVRPWPGDKTELEPFHLVVALTAQVGAAVTELPYATSLVEWNLPTGNDESLSETSKRLSTEIRDLMVLMRGEAAH